ncbi:nucleotide sugar dehydrogenase [Candidatus Parcubacteria bacterium]|jgi:nucleotide sugar dehydrogenase|nr:MAG: nucleotide sugar dehydrogenase [Candidatus Parcubacteria bacterium]
MKKRKKEVVTVVGLGYVGLPLAVLAAERGYRVFGVARNKRNINMLNRGVNTLKDDPSLDKAIAKKLIKATTSYEPIRKSDIVIVCVPTPIDEFYNPDLTPVISASKGIVRNLKKGQLVIIESTINPGVCEEVVLPILESTGKKVGKDFELAHCPERIDPGNVKWNVRNIPRCVGSVTKKGAVRAAKFYRSILSAEVRVMKSIKEAEATKIIENTFRDINIAYVNELAKSFDVLGIDVYDVIQGAATKPFAFMPHYPSVGVGGHCIAVDPYYLIERARKAGFDHKFLKLAREINNSMPSYTVEKLQSALNELGLPIKGTKIGILGLSYKANVGDMRESPSRKVIALLKDLGAKIEVFDPYFPEFSTTKSLQVCLQNSQAIILATNHREFLNLNPKELKKHKVKVVIDGKNAWNKEAIQNQGIVYKGIGR